jgi:regulator of replication initiation timing
MEYMAAQMDRQIEGAISENELLRIENDRLRDAIIKIIAHTSHTKPYPDELHVELLKNIERIARTALLPAA